MLFCKNFRDLGRIFLYCYSTAFTVDPTSDWSFACVLEGTDLRAVKSGSHNRCTLIENLEVPGDENDC